MVKRRRRARRSRPASRARKTIARALIGGHAVLIAFALVALGWLVIVYPQGRGPGSGGEHTLSIRPGMDLDALADRLAEENVIASPRVFAIYARLLGGDERLRSGEVLFTDDMSPRDVLQRIATGFGSSTVRVTIPEGFHRFGIAARLERWGVCDADEFLAATEDRELLQDLGIAGASAEGYLFPDTYRISQDLDAAEVVRLLVENWWRRVGPIYDANEAGLADLDQTLGWGPHDALILASIVEKEAAVSDERPAIARVFLNRLRDPEFRPKRLQADPTVSYGCLAMPDAAPTCEGGRQRITRAMLHDRRNPYNTYRHEGLPPGPICNPGIDSIRAVLNADPHRYLYFVARGHGRHTFSATLEEHNAAVARHRRNR